MSIPVDLADLPKTLADFDRGYLLTTAGGLVKAVSVRAVPEGAALRVPAPGPGSLANIAANPPVTLLFPPLGGGDLTLLVDGTALVESGDAIVTPGSAILHKSVGTVVA